MTPKTEKKRAPLLKNPVQSLVLWALSDGRAYTAVELAQYAKAPVSKIPTYLGELQESGMVLPENHRHHYFRIADEKTRKEIHSLLEPKMREKPKPYGKKDPLPDLKYCRSCHGHLAGKIGVEITGQMQDNQWLIKKRKAEHYNFKLTDEGAGFFRGLNLDLENLHKKGGIFAKACLDFSERHHHLGGKLGVAFLEKMKEKGWICRDENSRVHRLTEKGRGALHEYLELDLKSLE